ncbi:dihydrolipoamide acetyltransferase family protein [Nocardioides sp. AE5]|uniref:dihydrolipoamide acetyltransferase family protein n=1 Tax=Nocardioides sp. AE5 TaxID=2962573 RepID=UPI0028823702|nr:dihydrolipoamide acetyltransferase family protein [Nocardioides sp. AE5]MDT0203445.1 dihydrolipoamide acetyltransferase family protein [Nocardioides sp. AE5]
MAEFKLPDVGEGLTEAEIVSWKVTVGDTIEINDVIVEIETAKSLVELPSPYAGTVLALLVVEGETVEVGTPIISVGDADSAEAEIDLSNPAASGGGEGESLVGRMKAERSSARRPRRKLADAAAEHTARAEVHDVFNAGAPPQREKVERIVEAITPSGADPISPVPAHATRESGPPERSTSPRALAKPPVRKLARDLGIDLASLTPTGPQGTVTRDDVQAAAQTAMPEQYAGAEHERGQGDVVAAAEPGRLREWREPIKGVRKMMGQAMVDSAFSAPHVTEWITVDVTRTMEFVARLKERREFGDVKVSPLLVLARAVVLAMRRTPEINSFWDDAAGEVVFKSYVNLGIAAATPRGLVVPNIKDADALSLLEMAEALGALAATAREGKTQPAEMSGGTFTITNVGVFGVDAGTPIINPGESAILCFGAVNKRPWVDADGELCVRDVTTLALSFDHRHVDGEKGSRFLADVASILEDPASALLF